MSEQIYQSTCNFDDTSPSIGRCILPDAVPAGKRLILQTVTGWYYGDGAVLGSALLTLNRIPYAFPWVPGNPCCGGQQEREDDVRRFYGFNHYVVLSVDGPAELQFDADGGSFMGTSSHSRGDS